MTKLGVSVVIPTYNRGHLIRRALRSAISDIDGGDEIIVVDDGSSDATESVVREFQDPRIRYIRQAHRGAGAARNRGTSEARRELVAYLDSDDEWIPGKTVLQRRLLSERNDVLFCFTNFASQYRGLRSARDIGIWYKATLLPGQSSDRTWDQIMGIPSLYSSIAELPPNIGDFRTYVGDLYYEEMLANYILTSTLVVRAPSIVDENWFSTSTQTYEDWECFGRLAGHGLGCFLDHETTIRHRHPGPQLTDTDQLTCIVSRIEVLNNVWGSDVEFLRKYGREYDEILFNLRLLKVHYLLGMAQRAEALSAMRDLEWIPVRYRILAMLPSTILKLLTVLRRLAKGDSVKVS